MHRILVYSDSVVYRLFGWKQLDRNYKPFAIPPVPIECRCTKLNVFENVPVLTGLMQEPLSHVINELIYKMFAMIIRHAFHCNI